MAHRQPTPARHRTLFLHPLSICCVYIVGGVTCDDAAARHANRARLQSWGRQKQEAPASLFEEAVQRPRHVVWYAPRRLLALLLVPKLRTHALLPHASLDGGLALLYDVVLLLALWGGVA